jgi:hypothetical protein
MSAGRSAIFWDVTKGRTQHPFQFRGISLGALWAAGHDGQPLVGLPVYSAILIVGVGIVLVLIVWRPLGFLEDLTLLSTTVFLLSPKLHCGYFSLLALTMAPLLRRYRIGELYFSFGALALIADMYKWPVESFSVAFDLMIGVYLILVAVMVQLRWRGKTSNLRSLRGYFGE